MVNEQYVKEQIRNNYLKAAKKKANIKKYYQTKVVNKQYSLYYSRKRQEDIMVRITCNLANRLWKELDAIKKIKPCTYSDLLGCSHSQFEAHLKSKFTDGMDFDNYGEWEIDHIIPMSTFDLSDDNEIKKCCHYTNLQPLWKPDNCSKGNKI